MSLLSGESNRIRTVPEYTLDISETTNPTKIVMNNMYS